MKVAVGRPGTVSGLLLRMGQSLFAAASIAVMVSAFGFSSYTAFCYLIASMGLQALWSFGLACLDFYALWVKRDLLSAVLVSLFVVGDWVTATLSLAAACSSAGVAVLFVRDVNFCRTYPQLECHKYVVSIAFAFITWLLIAISSLVMFWLLASV
ncbi:S-adenosyl-L-methionine-dependent methyltransferase protein [Dioscorea alata]|uniref:CASP-like protein n=2 Tax=Dioscorea TaxID=4672 RepID=A0AB40CC53_DIOCR|nr:CASP-like protein 5B3 [Dioscorea cayenensis subsp. rotundata]KAH7667960.1 S-adenosyl-L-methionine-dependent methyltransferase protein [Dioscorea alata]